MANIKLAERGQIYGTTVMGSRGQIVIPADARKELGLSPGDKMLVMGKFGKIIALMKADQIENFVSMVMDHINQVAGSSEGLPEKAKDRFVQQAAELLKYSSGQNKTKQ